MATAVGLSGVRALRGRGRFRLLAVALVEAVNAARRVNQLLLAREERVALRADFDVDVALLRRARLERAAAGAVDVRRVVVGMDSLLHFVSSFIRWRQRALKQSHMILSRAAHGQAVQGLGCASAAPGLP